MNGFFLLAGLRYRMIANGFRRIDREGTYKALFFFILGALFVIGDYSFFYRVIDYLKGEEMIGALLITQLLDMMALTFFFMLFFSTIVAAISTLYLSSDLDLLISSPIGITAVFVSKFIQTVMNSSWMVLLFGLPMFSALGSVFGQGAGYYLQVLLLLLPFIVIPAALGILFTVSLIRYFPAKRMQQVVTFLMVLFIAGIVVFLRFLKPETLYREKEMADSMVTLFFKSLSVPKSPYLPSAWLTDGVMSLVVRDGAGFDKAFFLLSVTAFLLFVIVVFVARAVYFAGLSEAGTTSIRAKERGIDRVEIFIALLPFSPHQRALFVKDTKVFIRDPAQWSQLFILGALVVVYIFNIRSLPLDSYYLKNLVAFLNLGLAGFVLASVAIRFVFPSVSMEGGAIWIIRRSPITMSSFLWEKFFAFLLPLLFLGEVLMIGSNLLLDVDRFMMILSTASILLITLGITGLGVGLGAIYPRFKFENIAEVAAGAGGIIYMILCLSYIGIVIIVEANPVYIHFKRQIFIGDFSRASLYAAVAGILILTALAVFVPMIRGIKALEEMDL